MHRMPALLACLAATAGLAACGSSSTTTATSTSSAAAAPATTASTTTPVSTASGPCAQLLAQAIPHATPGRSPGLGSLERKALAAASAFRFSGATCVATVSPAQTITLQGIAQLKPTLAVDGRETVAQNKLEVRFIGSHIYVDVPALAAHDGGKPWLAISLKQIGSVSGLNFGKLLSQIRQMSPGHTSPLARAARAFHPLGSVTIDGQAAYGYQADFTGQSLAHIGLPGQLASQTAAELHKLGATREQVSTYVTAKGVALRTVVGIYDGSKLLTASSTASSPARGPLHVVAPPASKTTSKFPGAAG
jgi:hypothetical protein